MDIKKANKQTVTKDRSGSVGSPKKGGGGGKGTWGKGGLDDLIQTKTSKKDPNFDSEEEDNIDEGVVISSVVVTSPTEAILREYFGEGDIDEVAHRVKEVKDLSHVEFVRKAIVLAMERQPYERELISKMLSGLYGKTISSQDIADGFQSTLDKLEDTVLDIPSAVEMVGKFIARAIMDEVIPPAFVKSAYADSPLAKEALALANGFVNDPHRSRKLEHIWGPGDMASVKRLKQEVSKIIAEYLVSGDKEEADASVRRLNAPSFHFQIVRYAVRMALTSTHPNDRKRIMELLKFFCTEGLVVEDHMIQGFKACADALADIKLDIPSAPDTFNEIVKTAQQDGWLSVDYKL